jgi:hypothetical protein
MNNNKDLIKEAIADAKAVREVALANAKLALQEAFEPRLKTIMSAHLEEELNKDDMSEEELEEMMKDEEESKDDSNMEEEIDINQLLAELEEATKDEDEETEHMGDENLEEAKEEEEEKEDEEEMGDEEEIEVGDMTKEDIIDLIRQEISAQLDGEEAEMDSEEMGDMMGDEMGAEEMEADDLMEEIEALASTYNVSAEELYNSIRNLTEASKKKKHSKEEMAKKDEKKDDKKKDKELEEAINTINILKNELNEVNLLNAKLLYANKLFNKYSLSESQKLKVINSFDSAETVRETKLVFNTLNESFESETKVAKQKTKSITEGLGMASKPSGVSKPTKQTLNESNEFVTRLQKLANIKL